MVAYEELTSIGQYLKKMGAEFVDGSADQNAVLTMNNGIIVTYSREFGVENIEFSHKDDGENKYKFSVWAGTSVALMRRVCATKKKATRAEIIIKRERMDLVSATIDEIL
jgi:hypothetical protein